MLQQKVRQFLKFMRCVLTFDTRFIKKTHIDTPTQKTEEEYGFPNAHKKEESERERESMALHESAVCLISQDIAERVVRGWPCTSPNEKLNVRLLIFSPLNPALFIGMSCIFFFKSNRYK